MAVSLEQIRSRLHDLESKLRALNTSYSLSASTSLSSSLSDGCPSLSASSSVSSNGLSETEWVGGLSQSASSDSGIEVTNMQTCEGGDAATPKPKHDVDGGYFPLVGKLANKNKLLKGATSGPWGRKGRYGRRHQRMPYGSSELSHSRRSRPSARDFTYHTDNTRAELTPDSFLQYQQGDVGLSDPGSRPMQKNESTSGTTPRASAGYCNDSLLASDTDLEVPFNNIEKQAASKSPKISRKAKILPLDLVLAFMNTPSPIEALPSPLLSEKLICSSSAGMDLAGDSQMILDDRRYEKVQTISISRGARTGLGISVEGLSYPTTVRNCDSGSS